MPKNILKNFNFFADGGSYLGEAMEFTPPTLNVQAEDFRAAGMDVPVDVDMGMEKLEAEVKFSSYTPDLAAMVASAQDFQFTARGAFQSDDGTVTAVVLKMRGHARGRDPGSWKPGEFGEASFAMTLRYYQEAHDGRVITEIDVMNFIRLVDGVDQLAEIRAAIGA
jgi:P2 family phage contractile tail tube protein